MARRIAAVIDDLADDPRPSGCVKLSGPRNLYRVRVRNYRVVYESQDQQLLILIVRVAKRDQVYRNL
jgi:mRNA interferase RelE/StbE